MDRPLVVKEPRAMMSGRKKRRDQCVVKVAHQQDVLNLAPRLRAADRQELIALGEQPERGLMKAYAHSSQAFTIFFKNDYSHLRPLAMFGVAPHPLGAGVMAPWLLGSDDQFLVRREFARRCRVWIARLEEGSTALCNIAHQSNALHIRWLGWCGFTFVRALPDFGVEGEIFLEFARLSAPAAHHQQKTIGNSICVG
jgi:hypothetical protein